VKGINIRGLPFYNAAMPMPQQLSDPDVLKRITLCLVDNDQCEVFDRTLAEEHYVANARLAGQALRYVAELDGQWVALLTLSAAALHLKGRGKWLGWIRASVPADLG
jgi:hypothetical protein